MIATVIIFSIGKNLKSLDKRYNLNSEYNTLINKSEETSAKLKFIPRDYYGYYLVVKEMLKDNLFFGKGINLRVFAGGNLESLSC